MKINIAFDSSFFWLTEACPTYVTGFFIFIKIKSTQQVDFIENVFIFVLFVSIGVGNDSIKNIKQNMKKYNLILSAAIIKSRDLINLYCLSLRMRMRRC